DVGDDQLQTAGRARRGRRHSPAERDRAARTRRRELNDPKLVPADDVGVEPPAQTLVEPLRPIDVRHRDHDDLELHIDSPDPRIATPTATPPAPPAPASAHRY